jgi:hypothetical protein
VTYLTYADIAKRLGIDVRALVMRVQRGTFPPPDYKPNKTTALWKPETVDQWLKEKNL